jgi:hypothetical protein
VEPPVAAGASAAFHDMPMKPKRTTRSGNSDRPHEARR